MYRTITKHVERFVMQLETILRLLKDMLFNRKRNNMSKYSGKYVFVRVIYYYLKQ